MEGSFTDHTVCSLHFAGWNHYQYCPGHQLADINGDQVILTIIILIIAIAVIGSMTYRSGLENGRAIEISKSKELEYNCAHIWGPWKDSRLQVVNGNKLVEDVSAQERRCEMCNRRQIISGRELLA